MRLGRHMPIVAHLYALLLHAGPVSSNLAPARAHKEQRQDGADDDDDCDDDDDDG